MYLNNRLALPVNSSPVMVFPKQTFRDQKDALRYVLSFGCEFVGKKISLVRFETLLIIKGPSISLCFHPIREHASVFRDAAEEIRPLCHKEHKCTSERRLVFVPFQACGRSFSHFPECTAQHDLLLSHAACDGVTVNDGVPSLAPVSGPFPSQQTQIKICHMTNMKRNHIQSLWPLIK